MRTQPEKKYFKYFLKFVPPNDSIDTISSNVNWKKLREFFCSNKKNCHKLNCFRNWIPKRLTGQANFIFQRKSWINFVPNWKNNSIFCFSNLKIMLRYVLLVSKQSAWEHKTRKLFFPSFRFWFFPPISSVHTYSWNPFSQELQKFSARIHYKFKKTLFRLPTPETSLWTGETQIARLIGKMLLKKRTDFISWILPIRKDDLLCSLGLVRFNLGTQTKKNLYYIRCLQILSSSESVDKKISQFSEETS